PAGATTSVVTIAAAHRKVLTLDSPLGWSFGFGVTLDFGAPTADGAVVWHSAASSVVGPTAINVRSGILKGGDGSFSDLFDTADTTVDSGAVIDLAGFSTEITNLAGSGVVTNSGTAAALTLGEGGFDGSITGPLSLTIGGTIVTGEVFLTGDNTYTGST